MEPLSLVGTSVQKSKPKGTGIGAYNEIGVSGIRRHGGYLYEEFLPTLRGQAGVRVYREMRDNDPIVGSGLLAIEQVIRRASWFVNDSGSSPLEREAGDHLRTCMTDMSHSWGDCITEILSFLPYGWAWMEQVYKVRQGDSRNPRLKSKYADGRVGWRKIALRVQSTLQEWVFDETGGIKGMIQMAPPDYDIVTIPIEKSLLFRTKVEGNNPEGRSILRNSYRPWYFKKSIEELEAIGVERDLVGLPVLKPPDEFDIEAAENLDFQTYANKLLGNLRRDEQEGVLLPPGWDLSLLHSGSSRRQFDVDKIINRYDKRIALTMLAQFIMLGMDRVGSFALSKNQNDLFLVSIQGYLDSIAETFNMFAVPQLFRLNPYFESLMSGDTKLPRLVPGKVTEPNLEEIAKYVAGLAPGGFLLPDDEIVAELKRLGGFSEPHNRRIGERIGTEVEGEREGESGSQHGHHGDAGVSMEEGMRQAQWRLQQLAMIQPQAQLQAQVQAQSQLAQPKTKVEEKKRDEGVK